MNPGEADGGDGAGALAASALRVLLLVTDLEVGGTPIVVRELAARLPGLGGVQTEVACLAGPGPVARQIADRGIPVFAMGAGRAVALPLVVSRLTKLIRYRRIDLVFSFLMHANAVAACCRPGLVGVRFVQSIQTSQPRPRWHWLVQSAAQVVAECVVVPSESAARAASEWAGVEDGRIVVIPNAIEPGDWELAADRGGHVGGRVGFVGRLDPVKRVPDLVAAIGLLEPAIGLDIFGEGPERGVIESSIARLGVQARVRMHGRVGDVRGALGGVDVLVLPSAAEGFGLVLIEAMAAGVPVIGTDVPGIHDVVQDGRTGLLVGAGDPDALAGAIKRILSDEGLRRRLIAGGLAEVRRRYDWDVVLSQYRRVIFGGA